MKRPEMKFEIGQDVIHRENGFFYKIEDNNAMMKTCNGDWTNAYIYSRGGINYVRPKTEMEDGRYESQSN